LKQTDEDSAIILQDEKEIQSGTKKEMKAYIKNYI
jgi:hypothetical protein